MVLLLLDAYPLNRVGGSERGWFGRDARGVWMEKAPFFAAAALGSGLAHWAKSAVGTVASVESIPIVGRMGMAAYSTCFYLFKTVWPTNLLPLYEKPAQVDPFDPVFLMCGGGVVAITLVLFGARRRWRAGWVSWLIYAVMLAPVSGLVQIGAQIAADRYTQLACVGWSVLAGAGVVWAWGRAQGRRSRGGALAALVMLLMGVVAALVWLSREQSRMWRDSETLWATTLERDEDCWVGLNNLGMVYGESGRHLEATALLGRAVALRPEFPDAHMNLGSLYLEQARYSEAIREFEEAERRGLRDAKLYSNLAVAHFHQGEEERAMRYMDTALGLDPSNAEAHNNLGMIHFHMGRFEEAERAIEKALRLQPDYAKARENLEMVRAARGV